jgi:hypothetical protein
VRALADWLISRTSRRRVLLALAAMLVVQVVFGLAQASPAVKLVVGSMPDAHLGYDGAGLVALIRALADHPTATGVAYGLDVLMPTTGAAFVGLWLASLVVATGRKQSGWRLLVALPVVAMGVDLLENATVLTLVALYPNEIVAKAYVLLQAISATKWALHAAGLASVLVLLVAYLRRDRARG